MDRIFYCHRTWNFRCFGALPRKVKVIRGEDKTYSFEFPWHSKENIQVVLTTYDKKKGEIFGTFKVIEGGLSGGIVFEMRLKNKFAGTPDKFHHGTWTLYRGKQKHL